MRETNLVDAKTEVCVGNYDHGDLLRDHVLNDDEHCLANVDARISPIISTGAVG